MSVKHPHLSTQGRSAIKQIFRVIHEQSLPTFDENSNFISYYNWTGTGTSLSPPVNNHGNGEPKAYTGLVSTHHRPSDDLSIFREFDLIRRTTGFIFLNQPFLRQPMRC